jgi:hypothetical protein
MATATAKSTLGNIFGMVGTTAGAVTSVVETGIEGVEMLDRFVKKHSDNQRTQYVLEASAYKINLLKEMALDQSRREDEVISSAQEQLRYQPRILHQGVGGERSHQLIHTLMPVPRSKGAGKGSDLDSHM